MQLINLSTHGREVFAPDTALTITVLLEKKIMFLERSVLCIHVYIYTLGVICCRRELRLHVYIRAVLGPNCMLKGWKSRFKHIQVIETADLTPFGNKCQESQSRNVDEQLKSSKRPSELRPDVNIGNVKNKTTLTWHVIIFQFDTNHAADVELSE